jgi:S-adenosylmethionine hydrolase
MRRPFPFMTIVLFSDFGSQDIYVGQVKAVLEREAPGANVIDLLNDAPVLDVRASAHLLAALVPQFPQGTIFLAVVDPGVGSARGAVLVRAGGYRLVGPDNGLLSVFTARSARPECFRVTWSPPRLSASFHGRDLFAPVAARLAAETLPSGHLARTGRLSVDFGPGDLAELIYVDHYGNCITGLRAGAVEHGARLGVAGVLLKHARVFSEVPAGEAFWYENSASLVELSVNGGSAAVKLGLKMGDRVRVVR